MLTSASPDVERICMQNGLLFHELLSCFGHLSGLNSIIRLTNSQTPISVTEAQMRFERVTEVRPKPAENVEKVIFSHLTYFFNNNPYFLSYVSLLSYLHFLRCFMTLLFHTQSLESRRTSTSSARVLPLHGLLKWNKFCPIPSVSLSSRVSLPLSSSSQRFRPQRLTQFLH